jgi:hypothetical protein
MYIYCKDESKTTLSGSGVNRAPALLRRSACVGDFSGAFVGGGVAFWVSGSKAMRLRYWNCELGYFPVRKRAENAALQCKDVMT